MSALGKKRTFAVQKSMSALHPKADICSALADVRFVPIADIPPPFIRSSRRRQTTVFAWKKASYFSDDFVSSIGNSMSIIRPASCGACSAMRL